MLHNFTVYPIQDALRTYILPHLSAVDLAALRATHSALRDVVDHGTDAIWRRAARSRTMAPMPPTLDALAVQRDLRLRLQAARQLAAGPTRLDGPVDLVADTLCEAPDGSRVAGLDRAGRLAVLAADGTLLQHVDEVGRVTTLQWGNRDTLLLFGQEPAWVGVLQLPQERLLARRALAATPYPTDGACLSPDGAWLAYLGAGDRMVRGLHLPSGREMGAAPPHRRAIPCESPTLMFSPSGNHLLGIYDGGRRGCSGALWDLQQGLDQAPRLYWGLFFTFSPDGRYLAYNDRSSVDVVRLQRQGARRYVAPRDAQGYDIRFRAAYFNADGSRCHLEAKHCGNDVVVETDTWRPLAAGAAVPRHWEAGKSASVDRKLRIYKRLAEIECISDLRGGTQWNQPLPAAPGFVAAAAAVGAGAAAATEQTVEEINWCPWPRAGHIAALVTSYQTVILLNADAARQVAVWPASEASIFADTSYQGGVVRGFARIEVNWGLNERTLRIGRADGVRFVSFDSASPTPRREGSSRCHDGSRTSCMPSVFAMLNLGRSKT